MSTDIRRILESKTNKEGEVWPFRLVELDGQKDTVETSLRKLAGHKILSAPVRLSNGKYALIDIETVAVALNSSTEPQSLLGQPVGTLCTTRSALAQLEIQADILLVINLLASKSPRVLIIEDDKPVGIITHMDVVKFFVKNWDQLPNHLAHMQLGKCMTRNPLLVPINAKLGDAIYQFTSHGFGGAAVVDGNGQMVANLSVSDLRGVQPEQMKQFLEGTVEHFLSATKKDLLKLPITCKEETTFLEALRLMHQNHIHRVHVLVDNKPVGLWSTTDVLVELCKLRA
jgi:CBS domain-containing protein